MINDVISLCSKLLKCRSITPEDNGAIDCIAKYLSATGFETKVLTFSDASGKNCIKNLFARYGTSNERVLGFLGHSDVVPSGEGWEVDPFESLVQDNFLYGRGVCDMKGGIAAFCAAVSEFMNQKKQNFDGSIVILVTGDEEIGSEQGARELINWCKANGHMPHDCLLGEPSSYKKIGDRVYIGHRGSMNIKVKSIGQQGHVAYKGSYINSLSSVCHYITDMLEYEWKYDDKRFPKTNLEPTMLFTNNYATNVVPEESLANLNVRFSADYSSDNLKKICEQKADEYSNISLEFEVSGEAYCCDDEKLKSTISAAISDITGEVPEFSCAGGTSDGRYMIAHCNIIEFGLQDATIHQKNERAKVDDLIDLSKIYCAFLNRYFA